VATAVVGGVVDGGVVDGGVFVAECEVLANDDDVELVDGLALLELQPARTRPTTINAPTARGTRCFVATNLRLFPPSNISVHLQGEHFVPALLPSRITVRPGGYRPVASR
jgi:hypothetical protein